MLDGAESEVQLGNNTTNELKYRIYDHLLEYLCLEGYPTQAVGDFEESNVTDFILYTLGPVLSEFKFKMGRAAPFREGTKILSSGLSDGWVRRVCDDGRNCGETKEVCHCGGVKASCVGLALKQCLLALKDMQGNNGGGVVYGSITSGE